MSETNGNGKKPAPEAVDILRSLSIAQPTDPGGQEHFPVLCKLLYPIYRGTTCTRQAGRLTVAVQGTYYRVTLECPTERLMTSFNAATVDALFDQIERHVTSGKCEWEPNWDSKKKSRPVIEDVL